MAATGIRWDFGPVVAVPQDVRWGRAYEGYGEDPLEVAKLAEAFIAGLQGDDLTRPTSAAATAKHFVGDGGTAWGSSTTPGYSIDQGVNRRRRGDLPGDPPRPVPGRDRRGRPDRDGLVLEHRAPARSTATATC